SPFGSCLALYIGEVKEPGRIGRYPFPYWLRPVVGHKLLWTFYIMPTTPAFDKIDRLGKIMKAKNLDPLHHSSFGCIGGWHNHSTQSLFFRQQGHGEDASYRQQFAPQRQFTQYQHIL